MESVLRRTVVIGPEGRVEIPTTELVPGTTAEILVLPFAQESSNAPSVQEREVLLAKMEALRARAIAEGMELWDLDRINEEVASRRYGDRERYR